MIAAVRAGLPDPKRFSRGKKALFSGTALLLSLAITLVALEIGLTVASRLQPHPTHIAAEALIRARGLLLCMGDSVTHGFKLEPSESYPARLQALLGGQGLQRVVVQNLAAPGARTPEVLEQQIPFLQRLDARLPRIVLLEIGHNDFVRLEALNSFRGPHAPDGTYTPSGEPEHIPRDLPRSLRALRWAWQVLADQQGKKEIDASRLEPFQANLRAIRDAVRASRADLFLLTYVVPGPPPDDLPAHQAGPIRYTRQLQLEINAIIRQTAAELMVPLIDLESEVAVPTRWSRSWFLDSIHPTAQTNAAIAEAVHRYLFGARAGAHAGSGR